MNHHPVKSSRIASVGYDESSHTLEIRFHQLPTLQYQHGDRPPPQRWNNGPNPLQNRREGQGLCLPRREPHSGPQAVTRGFSAPAGGSPHAGAL